MKDIFAHAKFGDYFRTRCGEEAIYYKRMDNHEGRILGYLFITKYDMIGVLANGRRYPNLETENDIIERL